MTATIGSRHGGVDGLAAAKAASELADLRLLREVARAADAGRTQVSIAATLSVSQPAVHKMLVKARHTRGLFEDSPWEIALRYAAGEINRAQMLDTLGGWPWTADRVLDTDNPLPEQFVRGNWNQLERAVRHGYLTDEDYDAVLARTR